MSSFYQNYRQYIILMAVALFLLLILMSAPLLNGYLEEMLTVTPYIVWHIIFEFSSIIVAVCIFCVSYYSYEQKQNFKYLFLGSMLLLMGFIDFFHALSFKGMPDFLISDSTSNRATTFWIIARIIGGFGMLAASIIPARPKFRINKLTFLILPVVISMIILNLATYHPDVIPRMYEEGKGLTDIKIALELLVTLLYLCAIVVLLKEYKRSQVTFIIVLACALLVGISSELSFTLYTDVYGIYNFLGHLLKFIMYFIIFRVVFIQNIRQPYLDLSKARDEIKNYADNLDMIVDQRTEQINRIHQKLLDDLENARDIQMSMLPKQLPNSPKAAFEACYFPAERVSGDFYNVFRIDETRIGMYIGDVSGHGVSAAMLTVFLGQSFKAKKENAQGIRETLPPSKVLENLFSDFNQTNFKSEVYIVMLYGIFDFSTREFTFSSAGLNVSPLLVSASNEVSELAVKGFPICKMPVRMQVEYYDSMIKLKRGDKLFFYTDGLIEAISPRERNCSDSRLKEQLYRNRNSNALQLAKSVSEHVFQFVEMDKLQDDITFFVMEVR